MDLLPFVHMSAGEDVDAVPGEVPGGGAEGDAVEEVKYFAVAAFQPACIGTPFGEDFTGDKDSVAGVDGPESLVEHPVGVAREGEAVVRIVVAAFGELMDVHGFDNRAAAACVDSVSGERAGEAVLRHHSDTESGIEGTGSGFRNRGIHLDLLRPAAHGGFAGRHTGPEHQDLHRRTKDSPRQSDE